MIQNWDPRHSPDFASGSIEKIDVISKLSRLNRTADCTLTGSAFVRNLVVIICEADDIRVNPTCVHDPFHTLVPLTLL